MTYFGKNRRKFSSISIGKFSWIGGSPKRELLLPKIAFLILWGGAVVVELVNSPPKYPEESFL
ncbi:MAG: hypothetical protein GY820_47770 [Gammaproteobacteria bacterium]|nr:hypothetical protein [Gammaproteobacteria bacterium]